MELKELEREMKQRERCLTRCLFSLEFLTLDPIKNRDAIRLAEQEAFFLRDQLDKYHSVYAILREEQGSTDEALLQKV